MAPRLWPSGTVAVLASGPSLTQSDVDAVRGKVDGVIAINRTYQIAPWADVLYGSDVNKFWTWHQGVPEWKGLKFTVWTERKRLRMADDLGVPALQHTGDRGLELHPSGLRSGKNSAYAAINLAVHFGAKRIVLLGVDMQLGPKGQKHWHDDYADRSVPTISSCICLFQTLVKPLADLGVDVINSTRRTALTCFPRVPLEEAL